MRTSLRFKSDAIKNYYLNNTNINRIGEFYRCERNIENMIMGSEIEIKNPEDLAFITYSSVEDLIAVAEIFKFDYSFSVYLPENQTLKMRSSLGNIEINNGEILGNRSGIFTNCENYETANEIFLNAMQKNYYYFDIVYFNGENFVS